MCGHSLAARLLVSAGIGLLLTPITACGGRTPLGVDIDSSAPILPVPTPEVCNGLDDDLDTAVDEDFRDDAGRYIASAHCAGCGHACAPSAHALGTACAVLDETPTCVDVACEAGFAISNGGRCVDPYDHLCLPCVSDADCGDVPGDQCVSIGGEQRCAASCASSCPTGYTCDAVGCVPAGGSCSCGPGDAFTLACALTDPTGALCVGSSRCEAGVLAECAASTEVCDHVDNNCDGQVDEGFADARGAYLLDVHHCGECGVDCTESTIPEGDLVCGGDPFAPSCVLACPDAADGLQPGDRIDADRDIATGCECRLTSLDDVPGPVGAVGQDLDVNCDGADGIVIGSFYVATSGDDAGPGSPTRPLANIDEALRRAAESLTSATPRPHVFVASGTYTETLHLPDGVKLHGGYRPDFLALDPSGFRVDVRAPADTDAPSGAALVADHVGLTPTVVEWLDLIGRDATEPSTATFGALLRDPGPALSLRQMGIRAGAAGAGTTGADGRTGTAPSVTGAPGDVPRGANESASHTCTRGPDNIDHGGVGGANTCLGVDTSGGRGGDASCPSFAAFQGNGQPGMRAGDVAGGGGGRAGQDSTGPIVGPPCSTAVCCGLADFTVPTTFSGPASGEPGRDGSPGRAGAGCAEAFGRFMGEVWTPDVATGGTNAAPGSGGGGGGAGGGVEMQWMSSVCEFPDGLGGGGGGGCGGATTGIWLTGVGTTEPAGVGAWRTGNTFLLGTGGRAGEGGAGGAPGGRGAAGGAIDVIVR